ncbi:MAG TPA: hypothetical protein VGG33_21225 [Polyangia bacterium]
MTWHTRTLLMIGITLTLGLGAGCGVDDDDDSALAVTWDLRYVGGGNTPLDCAGAGTPTVRLDISGRRHKGVLSFDFPCGDRRGLTTRLVPDYYDLQLSLLDAKGVPISSLTGESEVRRHGATLLPAVIFDVQSWLVSWIFVVEGANGTMRSATCAEVGVKTVSFEATLAGETPLSFPFDCQPGLGITTGVRTGSWSYQLRLLDAAGQPLVDTAGAPVASTVKGLLVKPDARPEVSERFTFR